MSMVPSALQPNRGDGTWDGWLRLEPIQHGRWRAGLMAALVLRARGKTKHHLAAIDHGGYQARYRRAHHQAPDARLMGLLEMARLLCVYREVAVLKKKAAAETNLAKKTATGSKTPKKPRGSWPAGLPQAPERREGCLERF